MSGRDGVRAGSRAAHGTGDAVSAVPASIPDAWRPVSTAPKDRRILVSCTESAPYPVMIAMWDGDTQKWVSRDHGAAGKTWSIVAWQPLPEPAAKYFCGFCCKGHEQVEVLVAGLGVHICNECIDLCCDIVRERAQAIDAGTAETQSGSVHESAARQGAPNG